MAKLPKKLEQKLEKRRLEDALRILPEQLPLVDFSSNDYLGFARKEELAILTDELLKERGQFKNGSTGSRLLTGNHILYRELEDFLAKHHNSEATLVFNSGYDANIGFFSSVPQRGDVIVYDELVHASIRDGIQMSNAKSYKFIHNDLNDLRKKVDASLRTVNLSSSKGQSKSDGAEIYVVTESVFSMDGDSPDLEALVKFCSENGYHLIIDEAHAVGIFGEGRGLIGQLGLEKEVFAKVVTFGKALGSHGAAILCSEELKRYLVNFARSLIYTTALSPHSVASILASHHFLEKKGREELEKLQSSITYFKEQIKLLELVDSFIPSDSPIHCFVVSGNQKVKQLSKHLKEEGFDVKPILSPTVKMGEERLRFCLHSYNTKEEIDSVLQIIRAYI